MNASHAAGPTSSDPHGGIPAEAMRLFGSLSRHLHALAALAGLEAREAASLYVVAVAAVVGGLLAAGFFYVFLLIFLALVLDRFFGLEWVWTVGIFTLIHLGVAVAAIVFGLKRFKTPVFRATSEEIRRDVASLRGTPTAVVAEPVTATPVPPHP